jgi:hypothetical protein
LHKKTLFLSVSSSSKILFILLCRYFFFSRYFSSTDLFITHICQTNAWHASIWNLIEGPPNSEKKDNQSCQIM